MTSYALAMPMDHLTIRDFTGESSLEKEMRRAERGMLTVSVDYLGAEDLTYATLSIDPETENHRVVQSSPLEKDRLTFTFDSQGIADGKHLVVVEGMTIAGKKVSSQPVELNIDNGPPSLVRIDSVVRIDSAEEGPNRNSVLVQVQATVVDDVGISLVELHDGIPDAGGRLIGASQRIEDNRCTIVAGLDYAASRIYSLYLRAYDQAGNYRVDRVTVQL